MTTQELTFNEADHAAVSSATRQLKSRYRDYVDFEDVQQELYLWLFRHYSKVEEWREAWDERRVENTLRKALRNAGEKYCRKEKSVMCGYDLSDEFFYSIGQCGDLLELYFTPDWMAPSVDVTHEADKKPPNEGGNLMAMIADVGRAYEALSATDQSLLRRIYDGTLPVRDAVALEAAEWDINTRAADQRIRRVLGRLRAELGGPRPWQEKDE